MKRSKYIDHTLLKPEATQDQIENYAKKLNNTTLPVSV